MLLTGCVHEEDDLFSKSAAERLNESSELYANYLQASPGGWAMQYYPTTALTNPQGRGYLMLVGFDKDHSVRVAMQNGYSNGYQEDRSMWEVIADNGPVLSFNTYNQCLHTFSSPEDIPLTSTNEQGTGFGGDYEFVIVDVASDNSYIMLKGKKRGTYNLLTPLEPGTDYESYLSDVNAFTDRLFAPASPSFCVLDADGQQYKLVDATTGIPAIYPYNGDPITESSLHPYLVTKRDGKYNLRFRSAITFGEQAVQNFVFDEAADRFTCVENDRFTIDGDSPARFFSDWAEDNTRVWMLNRSAEMSDKMKEKYEAVYQDFRSMRFTLNNIRLSWNDDQMYFGVQYRSTSSTTANYAYSISRSDDQVKLDFTDDVGNAGNVRSAIASLDSLIREVFSQQFVVTAGTTRFDLRTVRLTSVGDPDLWFVLTLN